MHSRLGLVFGVVAALVGLAGCAKKSGTPVTTCLMFLPPRLPGRAPSLLNPVAVRQFSSPAFLREGPIVLQLLNERNGLPCASTYATVTDLHNDLWMKSVDRAPGLPLREVEAHAVPCHNQRITLIRAHATPRWLTR
jgi:hypothetical protein